MIIQQYHLILTWKQAAGQVQFPVLCPFMQLQRNQEDLAGMKAATLADPLRTNVARRAFVTRIRHQIILSDLLPKHRATQSLNSSKTNHRGKVYFRRSSNALGQIIWSKGQKQAGYQCKWTRQRGEKQVRAHSWKSGKWKKDVYAQAGQRKAKYERIYWDTEVQF